MTGGADENFPCLMALLQSAMETARNRAAPSGAIADLELITANAQAALITEPRLPFVRSTV